MRRGLLLLALPLALVACGGSGHQSSAPKLAPVAYVKQAAHKTARAPSEHMTLTGKASASGQTIHMNGSGDFANTGPKGTLALTFSASGLSGSINEVLDGTTAYVSSPLFAASLPSGKKWMKLDMEKFGKAKGFDYSQLLTQTPTSTMQQLEAAGTVVSLGAETVDGVQTTHFRVTNLDVSKLPLGKTLASQAHPKYGPIDVWIGNADGYVRRIALTASYAVSGKSANLVATIDFSNFGEAVHVTLPPASQTFDATNAAIQGIGG